MNDKTTDEVVCVKSQKLDIHLTLEDFLKDDDDDENSDEYFDLKNKYEKTRNVTNKIYNYSLKKILDQNN